MTNQATRLQLQQIIAGLREGVILIETDQTISYANPAALGMHGATDLSGFGATVDAYRHNYIVVESRNRLERRGHPIDCVIQGEAVDDVVVRVARREAPEEDWVHRIRSLVMTDDAGLPDYVVVVITDMTEQVEAEERFEKTFAANPAPSLICRLANLQFVKTNEGFLELTGFKRDQVLGRTVYEIDVFHRAERRDFAIERLRAGQTIPQMEACLSVPRDQEKLVIVAGQPLEVGDEPCMLFTFVDLEPRRKAESALRHSEERFVKCFRFAPIPMSIATTQGHRFFDVNESFCSVTGYTMQDVVGRDADELDLWLDPEARRCFERELARTGHIRAIDAKLKAKDGTKLDCLISAETVAIGDEPSILCAFQDITARKHSETNLVAAIETVMADASWFSQAVVEKLAALRKPHDAQGNGSAAGLAELTAREREVLSAICQGLDDEAISARLSVSRNTVRNHKASLYRKLGVNRRSALIVWARERGFGDGEGIPRPHRRKPVQKNRVL